MLPCFQDFVFFRVLFYLRKLLYTDIVSLYKLIITWSQCVPKVLQYHVIVERDRSRSCYLGIFRINYYWLVHVLQ